MATPEQANQLKKYVDEQMEVDRWIDINEKQMDVFKHLIAENYGWPVFTLNINRLNNKIMKIIVW